VLGFASGPQVAARYRLDQREVGEHLLDEQAAGLVQRVAFADASGWSLTEAGRLADERRLSEELAPPDVGPASSPPHGSSRPSTTASFEP